MFESHNQEKIKQEKEIQKNIFRNIDEFKSFVFYAGAGAGKTYALKESLRYLLKSKRKDLQRKTQKIICITYTNVAVNEIKRRIGKTDLVLVSTIHERMWDIIKKYKKELLPIHKEKLQEKIQELEIKIEQDKVYSQILDKKSFENKILSKQEELRKIYNLKSEAYKEAMKNIIDIQFSNVNNFKSLINNIIQKAKYQNAIEKINNNPIEQINELEYERFYNSDRLEDMKFSHNTLLEYTYKMTEKYEILRKVLISKYPYIFVDEFQDTHKCVVDSLRLLIEYARNNNKKFLVGYFGDAYQEIYSDGIGKKIIDEQYLRKIEKKYNRRSATEIINLINKFRDDGLEQETIYNDANGGKIELEFGNGDDESVRRYIDTLCKIHNFNEKNNLHVLFLTNKLIAKFGEFEEFYNFFYVNRFINFKDLSSQIMSNDITKLHETVHYIYKVIYMYLRIKSSDILGTLLNKEDVKELTLKQYKSDIVEIITRLNSVDKFIDILNGFIAIDYENNYIAKKLLKKYIKYKNLEKIKAFFIESLKIEEEKYSNLDNFLNLNIKVFENWYKYVTSKNENTIKDKIVYHTYHSTKGEEYDNILIIMENEIYKNSIKNFFVNRSEMKDEEFKYVRNLLYVSFSRAKKNLFIYYIDENLDDNDKTAIFNFIKGN